MSQQSEALSVPQCLHHLWFKSQLFYHLQKPVSHGLFVCFFAFLFSTVGYVKQKQKCHKRLFVFFKRKKEEDSITLEILWIIRYLSVFVCES